MKVRGGGQRILAPGSLRPPQGRRAGGPAERFLIPRERCAIELIHLGLPEERLGSGLSASLETARVRLGLPRESPASELVSMAQRRRLFIRPNPARTEAWDMAPSD